LSEDIDLGDDNDMIKDIQPPNDQVKALTEKELHKKNM
jgi:hypothetical protein